MVQGHGAAAYLNKLDADEQAAFLARYHDEIARAYPALADGTVLLPFPRLFLVAGPGTDAVRRQARAAGSRANGAYALSAK